MTRNTNLPTVVPNARLVAALRRADARARQGAGGTPWLATEYLTLGSWVERSMQQPRLSGQWGGGADFLLTPGQSAVLWETVVDAPLPEGNGSPLELANAQIDPLSVLAADAHRQLVEWALEDAWSRHAGSALGGAFEARGESPELRAMRAWLPAYRARCAALAACDPVDLLTQAAATHGSKAGARFIGFGQVGPTLQRLGVPTPGLAQVAIEAGLMHFMQREDEISAACDWALDCRARGVEGGIAVVLPDLQAIEAFGRQVERYRRAEASPADGGRRIWAGVGNGELAAQPLIAHALLLLGLPRGLRAADAMTLLQSPYLAGFSEEFGSRARLVAGLMATRGERGEHRDGSDHYSGEFLAGHARASCPLLAKALEAVLGVARQAPARQSLQAWMAFFWQSLQAAGWPGGQTLGALERAASDDLARAFDDASELDAVLGASTRQEALHRLRRVLRRRRLSLPVAADAMELLTLEEAVAQKPAAVWVLGLNDSLFPRLRTPNPLLPQALLREAGVPGSVPAQDLDFDRACLAQVCASAREVQLSCAVLDGDSKLRPSPGLAPAASGPPPPRRLPERWRGASPVTLESRPEEPPVPFSTAPEVEVRGGTRVLADQAACPFRAFATHRLRVSPLELKPPGPDARERGTLVHAVLAAFWARVGTQAALLALSEASLESEVAAAVEAGLAAEDPPLPAALAALERVRLQALLHEWLAQDRLRQPFRVLETETPGELSIGGLRFRLQIDRVDEVRGANGPALFIVDYKTGNPKARVWDLPRPEEPQLPLYALARARAAGGDAPVAVAGIGFARVTRGKAGWVTCPGKFVGAAEPPALETDLLSWQEALEMLAVEFRAGHAAVDPKRGEETCRYCDYTVLCRRHEAPEAETEEDADEPE